MVELLTIDTPPVNAMNSENMAALVDAVEKFGADSEARVMVITGAGKCFVAGADINELATCDAVKGEAISRKGHETYSVLYQTSKPIIAAVNGMALGGGLELALSCDIRVVDESTKLGLPESGLGILPGAGGTQLLSRMIGVGRALDMMLAGRLVSPAEGQQLGFVERVAPKGEALNQAMELAQALAKQPPLALGAIKRLAYAPWSMSLKEGLLMESREFAGLCGTHDMKEGLGAFQEKRKPEFKGC
jgi:enoyl-CoA hydratase/carnithine racemase